MANRVLLNETSYFGAGAINYIPDIALTRGYKKAFIVTDASLVKFGVVAKVTDLLNRHNLKYSCFDEVKPNPTIENVHYGIEAYKRAEADYIIAIGGGSPIDTSKAIGIVVNNPEFYDIRSLEGNATTKNRAVPIIAIPTTAGTATEVTADYVITDVENKRKFLCVDAHAIPSVAIVDAEMMSGMPKGLTAATGMDALTHAIEAYITKGACKMTDMYAIKAIELISNSLRKAMENDPVGREDMSLGQYLAGVAFSNAGLGLVHAMAHPLSAVYGVPHGVANAIILPTVMEYNADYSAEKYRTIADLMGITGVWNVGADEYRKMAVYAVKKLAADVGIPAKLSDVGVKYEDIPFLAESALKDACTEGNPRKTSVIDIKKLYESMM